MISTELLNKILGEEIIEIDNELSNTICYTQKVKNVDFGHSIMEAKVRSEINIFELIHKCKDWAYAQGYTIIAFKGHKDYSVMVFNKDRFYLNTDYLRLIVLFNSTNCVSELEAVIKAINWVIKRENL